MIDITDRVLYRAALRELRQFKRTNRILYRGRFVQMFLALKFYQNDLPDMTSGRFVPSGILEALLDDLYMKRRRPLNDCILMLFEDRYLPRCGQNIWRNHFRYKKGIGCCAPVADLGNQAFLDEARVTCPYLRSASPGVLAQGTCSLREDAEYRGEEHRKWLRIGPGRSGYATVNLNNIDNYIDEVAPNGNRIPIIPLMVALNFDSPLVNNGRSFVDVSDFASAFNFTSRELGTYFDDSALNVHNQALLNAFRNITCSPVESVGPSVLRSSARVATDGSDDSTKEQLIEDSPASPPAVNTGWEAERYVRGILSNAGWTVFDQSRKCSGYDLLALRGSRIKYIDVKSSLTKCLPTLTANEWEQARVLGASYVLAIIENFDNTSGENVVNWVVDPVNRCVHRKSDVIVYSIARSQWQGAVVSSDAI